MNKVAGGILLVASLPCALFGYLEGGGVHGFDEFQSMLHHKPFAMVLLLAAAICLVGGLTAFMRKPTPQ